MFRFSRTSTILEDTDNIIVAIVTNNIKKVKELVNKDNVNQIIDMKNRYTSLHYAITLPYNDITQYLLDIGADPKIKQSEGFDAYELSLRSGKKFIFDYYKIKQQMEIKNLEFENTGLKRKVADLNNTIQYLDKSIDSYNNKISTLKTENNKLKRDLDDAEKAFENLVKKQKK
jgi:ankyrin repeat protein